MPARQLGFWTGLALTSAAAGYAYGALLGEGGSLNASFFGLVIGLMLFAFERGLILGALHQRLRRASTPVFLAGTLVVYISLTLVANAVASVALWSIGALKMTLADAVLPPARVIVYSVLVAEVLVFVLRMRDLIGAQVFVNLLLGRYHRPVREERVFLFLDLVGSTRFAEREGDIKAQEFIGEFFAALAQPVRRHRGLIDDYIGDMALITWPLARGIEDARCLKCVLDVADRLARDEARWRRSFGTVPSFRAVLHGGPVTTAEVGVDRHKIAYFGDTVNTTARLEALGKALDAGILISTDLLARIPHMPAGMTARPRGEHALKGRDQPLGVASLHHSRLP